MLRIGLLNRIRAGGTGVRPNPSLEANLVILSDRRLFWTSSRPYTALLTERFGMGAAQILGLQVVFC